MRVIPSHAYAAVFSVAPPLMESRLVVLHKQIVHILVELLVVLLHADQTLYKETEREREKDEEVISMMT